MKMNKDNLASSSGNTVVVNGEVFELFIDRETIHQRIQELAQAIMADYSGRFPVFICVLKGGFIFLADLIREMDMDCEVGFIRVASYGDGKQSSGMVTLEKDVNCDVAGRHVLIVEDIVDTGRSVEFIQELMMKRKPLSLKFITLLHKPESTEIDIQLDYVGFKIPSRFVIGYGLDYAQKGRNLPAIYILPRNGT